MGFLVLRIYLLPICVSVYSLLLLKGENEKQHHRFQWLVAKLNYIFGKEWPFCLYNKQLAQSAAKGQMGTKESVSVVQEFSTNQEQTRLCL